MEAIPRMEPDPAAPAPEIGEGLAVVQHTPVTEPGSVGFSPAAFFSALLKQLYLDQNYVPRSVLVPVEFPDRGLLADILAQRTGKRIEISGAAAGRKAVARRSGIAERQAVVRSALPRVAAGNESDPGGAAGRTDLGRTAPKDRVLSISRTSRARRRWPRWLSGRTAR